MQAPPPSARRAAPPPAAPAAPVAVKPAEPEARAQTYTVKKGDTLQMIALDHGLDYRELASWNNIENVNRILVGQVLRLAPPGETFAGGAAATGAAGVTTAPLRPAPGIVASGTASPSPAAGAPSSATPAAPGSSAPTAPAAAPAVTAPPVATARNSETYKTQPKALKEPYSERALRDMQQRVQMASTGPATAASAVSSAPSVPSPGPAASPVEPAPAASAPPAVVARADPKLEQKSVPAPSVAGDDDEDRLDWMWPATGRIVTGFSDTANVKGIDIAGKAGQPVVASAPGKVVYAGSGLRGYGKLIIIKHSKNYLSAYAHNRDIMVKEGQQVTRGQKIAEMGDSDSDQVKLHFEIRRLGKPMDPLKYLPPA